MEYAVGGKQLKNEFDQRETEQNQKYQGREKRERK